ncbi:hypothetical protein K501DRAFT_267268 [Backusella circina FSU 941]|nr:hypothetical protein K501DRAFT_267268 [Backusella circina FSU 941]
MFGNMVIIDGFSASFIYFRPKRPLSATKPRVPLENFTLNEVKKKYKPYFINSGRAYVFTAVNEFDATNVEMGRCSTSEYYMMVRSISYLKKLNQQKSKKRIMTIESGIPIALKIWKGDGRSEIYKPKKKSTTNKNAKVFTFICVIIELKTSMIR